MQRISSFIIFVALLVYNLPLKADDNTGFATKAPADGYNRELYIKTNAIPWFVTIPNLGIEYAFSQRLSAELEVWYCPWKLTQKFSVKTVGIFPELKWWLRPTRKGSYFDIHLNVAWFNVRANDYRYQDTNRPLLGGGLGYGYKIDINSRWGVEFELGIGFANIKYNRFYNVPNGALKDTRVSTYWGIDKAAISFSYYICDL